MADQFHSANAEISMKPGNKPERKAAILEGMTKDVRKRWIIVGSTVAAVIMFSTTYMTTPKEKKAPAAPPAQTVDTTPKSISSQKDWKTQTGADMLQLRAEMDASRKTQAEILSALKATRDDLAQLRKNPPAAAGAAAGGSTVPTGKVDLKLPAPPTPPASLRQPEAPKVTDTPLAPAPPPVIVAPEVKRSPARAFVPVSTTAAGGAGETTLENMVPNTKKGILPGGSFSAATMISGVEAFTGGTAQSQPQPLVLRLDANAILPNAASYAIKGCHVLASVWGDMSSERVYGRLATLTCVDVKDNLVLSEDVEGVLIDSDGKNGIRGVLQDRQGAKLARALLAGFAEGLGAAFGAAQSTVTTTGLGTTSNIMNGKTLKAGAYSGAEQAASQLADFYMKQAEATMPVIAVDAGRKISVLFTKSKSLSFEPTGHYRPEAPKKITVERTVR